MFHVTNCLNLLSFVSLTACKITFRALSLSYSLPPIFGRPYIRAFINNSSAWPWTDASEYWMNEQDRVNTKQERERESERDYPSVAIKQE